MKLEMIGMYSWWLEGCYIYILLYRAYISFIRAYSRLKDLNAKAMSLHDLCKSFGLDKSIGTETKD